MLPLQRCDNKWKSMWAYSAPSLKIIFINIKAHEIWFWNANMTSLFRADWLFRANANRSSFCYRSCTTLTLICKSYIKYYNASNIFKLYIVSQNMTVVIYSFSFPFSNMWIYFFTLMRLAKNEHNHLIFY